MIITTKFDVGDKVFVMDGDRVKEGVVSKIEISYIGKRKKVTRPLVIEYDIKVGINRNIWSKREGELFATKQELINSL